MHLNKFKNTIARILAVLGLVQIIGGLILGYHFGNVEVPSFYSSYIEFSWPIFFSTAVTGFVSGMLFIGFAEVINLLQRISNTVHNSNNEI